MINNIQLILFNKNKSPSTLSIVERTEHLLPVNIIYGNFFKDLWKLSDQSALLL